jgi:hypothetical protein
VIRDVALIMDETVQKGVLRLSSDEHTERLGIFDTIALQAVVDQVAGTAAGTLTVVLFHSCDGRAFEPRTATPVINAAPVNLSPINAIYGGLTDALPTLPFVRARVLLAGANLTSARVRLYAVMRDIAD